MRVKPRPHSDLDNNMEGGRNPKLVKYNAKSNRKEGEKLDT